MSLSGCSEFNARGTGGDCEPSNAIEFMRGRTALLLSANLQGIVLCPPNVCNPAFVLQRIEVKSAEVDPEEFATIRPAPGNDGEITGLTLCNVGPGSGYKTVSSLKTGQIVKIVRVGGLKGWLIVENPV